MSAPGSQSDQRKIKNEQMFAELNRRIKEAIEQIAVEPKHLLMLDLICECSDPNCTQQIAVTARDYERLHKLGSRFIVATGHEDGTVEKVIEAKKAYSVVEKFGLPNRSHT